MTGFEWNRSSLFIELFEWSDFDFPDAVSGGRNYLKNRLMILGLFSFLWKMSKKLDHIPADGLIIPGMQIQMKKAVNIVQFHRGRYKAGSFFHFLKRSLLFAVIFIPDITENLFDDIFQRNETGSFSIFIQYDGKA